MRPRQPTPASSSSDDDDNGDDEEDRERWRVTHIRPLPLRMLAGDVRRCPAIVVAVTGDSGDGNSDNGHGGGNDDNNEGQGGTQRQLRLRRRQ